ncbi:MAG TPA: radical SAM protein [Gammaproteobacteria bacterium]|nr:radical SAM protein [Gammaproteobacteria bacterium]
MNPHASAPSHAPRSPVLAYPIGDRLYLNITDRCTLRCRFCPKHQAGPRVHDYDLSLRERPSVERLIAAMGDPSRYREVVFCGFGEPTLRLKRLIEIADHIQARGGRVRLNTDGLANRVFRRNVLPDLAGRIDALSVSMNAQCEAVYVRHCRPALSGSYAAMLDFLREAPLYVDEVTATAIDGLAGVDIGACERLARDCGVGFRRRTLDVVG